MKRLTFPFLTLVISLIATALLAHGFKVGDLVVEHPMSFETPVGAKTGAGYLKVVNLGDEVDRLIEVRADFPRVMLHKSEEIDGVAKMSHVDSIEIPAKGAILLAPGGFHVMFMGLGDDRFEVGEQIPAVLVFEKAGELEIEFAVEARVHGEDHSGHGHSD